MHRQLGCQHQQKGRAWRWLVGLFFSCSPALLTHIQHHLLGVQAPHADPSPHSGDAASKDDPMDDDDDDDDDAC